MKKCFLLFLLAIILAGCAPVKIDSAHALSQVLILALFALFAFTVLVLGSLALVMLFRFLGLWFRTSRRLFVDDDVSEPVLSWQKPETPALLRSMPTAPANGCGPGLVILRIAYIQPRRS